MSLLIRKMDEELGEPMPGEGHVGVNSLMVVKETEVSAYSCRILRIEAGGATANHSHSRIHVVLALSGVVCIETDREIAEINPGIIVTIPGDVPHKFVNVSRRGATLLVQNIFPKANAPTIT